MSALANKHIDHNIELSEAITDAQQAATPISVTARIDYILRFSKQAVLVVDDNTSNYTQLARQYLANLSQAPTNQKLKSIASQDVNVAFVVASSKLNDIQMRSRLVEQLFANTLFDPEQSLAVSIHRLVKQHNDAVTIVIEHAQTLSLQLKYELCQLVDIAHKTKTKINVVLFGQEQTAKEISANKNLFDKKISIIEAKTGHVIALDNARFNGTTNFINNKTLIRIGIISILSIFLLLLSWFFLTQHENLSLSNIAPVQVVTDKPVNQIADESTPSIAKPIKQNGITTATNNDIYLALVDQSLNFASSPNAQPAKMSDILEALVISEENVDKLPEAKAANSDSTLNALVEVDLNVLANGEIEEALNKKEVNLPVVLNNEYYQGKEEGFVIQIAGFTDLNKLSKFTAELEGFNYYSYEKMLNTQKFIVITSEVFTNKELAKAALIKLPKATDQFGSFIKSVSTIKREINTVKG